MNYILGKFVYIEYTKLFTNFKKMRTLNIKTYTFYEYFDIECTDHMLLVICEERCPHNKNLYIKYTKFCTFFENLCTLNIQNYI